MTLREAERKFLINFGDRVVSCEKKKIKLGLRHLLASGNTTNRAKTRAGSQSRLMTFCEMGIFSRITSQDETDLMRLHETKSHEISLMRSRYY